MRNVLLSCRPTSYWPAPACSISYFNNPSLTSSAGTFTGYYYANATSAPGFTVAVSLVYAHSTLTTSVGTCLLQLDGVRPSSIVFTPATLHSFCDCLPMDFCRAPSCPRRSGLLARAPAPSRVVAVGPASACTRPLRPTTVMGASSPFLTCHALPALSARGAFQLSRALSGTFVLAALRLLRSAQRAPLAVRQACRARRARGRARAVQPARPPLRRARLHRRCRSLRPLQAR